MARKDSPGKGLSKDDQRVWAEVQKKTKAYAGKTAPDTSPKPSADLTRPRTKAAPTQKPNTTIVKPQKSLLLPDGDTLDKLRRGKFSIDKTIDLHGMTQTQAHSALLRFITRAKKEEARTLLIITGKGRVSDGGGVLRKMLPLWLEEGTHAKDVLAITPARPTDGGSGAFYVRLRKKK